MLILRKNDNILKNFELYKNKKYKLEKEIIGKDHKNLIDKSSDNKNYTKNSLSKYTS